MADALDTDGLLASLGLDLIPAPRRLRPAEGSMALAGPVAVVDAEASGGAAFAAESLAVGLRDGHGVDAARRREAPAGGAAIHLRLLPGADMPPEGYRLEVRPEAAVLTAGDDAGLFWGTRTLLQAVSRVDGAAALPCLTIDDHPALELRAVHYDTKHHQGTFDYVRGLIDTLAGYKVNALVWEWEDKLAYERHPEVGAPGAFTKAQMRELTAYAAQRHVQLIPLVQGLGHVSFILKHPRFHHLREIPASAWEFCPLHEGSYELLFDLWDEAIEATPGVDWLHIGSDETYELGQGEACGCRALADEIGRDGLMQRFLHRSVAHIESRGRRALSWGGVYRPGAAHRPPPGMVYTDGSDVERLRSSCEAGYDILVYSPNPGIEPLFLGYLPWVQSSMFRDAHVRERAGSFADTARTCAAAAGAAGGDLGGSGRVLGTITTSWDDSGLHNDMWVPRFVCAAEYSWSPDTRSDGPDLDGWPALDRWIERFYRCHYGPDVQSLRELFQLLQDGALFYYDTFQRRVWHWNDIGKIQLPDLPRPQLEFSNYWRTRYFKLLTRAREERQRCRRARQLLDANLARDVRRPYELELMSTVAELMRHNTDLVLMLGDLETEIEAAHKAHFSDRAASRRHLERALQLVDEHLADRERVFAALVETWERTRLPKGMSTPGQDFLHAPDRARHFANRTPDMRYLILDEELLDLEGYRERLAAIVADYDREPA